MKPSDELFQRALELIPWGTQTNAKRPYPDFEAELLLLLDNAPLRAAMGQQGRDYVLREYAWPEVEARFWRALETL